MTPTVNHTHKTRIRIILTFLILFLFVLLFQALRHERSTTACIKRGNQVKSLIPSESVGSNPAEPRQNITFILGEDEDPENPYYTEAANYYLNNPEGRTEYLVKSCRSLLEVRNYLVKNPPVNSQPWGLINLVSHGNQWLGLSVKVTPESKRATSERILENIQNGHFKELPDSVVDSETEIFVHGCGIGNNPELVKTIGLAFGGKTNTPKVMASRLFEYYSSITMNGMVKESERYVARTWNVCYKMGEQPDKQNLLVRLAEKYPNAEISWSDALSRELPRWSGDTYYYTFEVPVKFTIRKSDLDSIPDFSDEAEIIQWTKNRKEIKSMLERIEMAAENFRWSVTTIYANNEDGSKSPALWIKGYCTVLCVIKPLIDERMGANGLSKPFKPGLADKRYYYVSNS